MERNTAPNTCPESDDCDHNVHVRTHERNPRRNTPRHKDAPEVEGVCSIHGVVYSA